MRIISGKYKGKQISLPRTVRARPTTDIAKEGLFNILANQLSFEGLRVLDLYAGTGSIGLEFLSRGVSFVVMVEYDRFHVSAILGTIKKLGIENVLVRNAEAIRFCKKGEGQYDLIFADPPFDTGHIEQIPDIVMQSTFLTEDGLFILEHSKNYNFDRHPDFMNMRKYGAVCFSFFSKKTKNL